MKKIYTLRLVVVNIVVKYNKHKNVKLEKDKY